MEEKNKEFTLAQEHAAPPPECAALPPEVLPPDTVLPGEASAAESAAALKKKAAKWKKIAIMLVGLSAMTAVAVTGGTAEDPVPATPDTPPVQQEPYVPPEPEPEPLAGVLHYTIYNDTFDDSGVPLILAEGTVDMTALSDTPLALPQPETPSDGSYAFLGWAGRYDTAGGKVWTTVPDPLTADFAASIRPGDTGERSIVLRAAWRLTEQSRYPWSLTLDDGVNAVTYEAAVPMASGGSVYLCAYPQPTRDGYRFAGWLDAAGERVDLLPASAFFAKTADGETDWRTTVPVTLTAEWEKA